MAILGAHVRLADPLQHARQSGAEAIQMFLSNPQSWKKPKPREDAEDLRNAGLPIYVHAPYLVNVASANNRIRIPSRKILQDCCDASAEIGASAVVVHGGHVTDDESVEAGFDRWRKALDYVNTDVPILIENTAGGTNAMAREIEVIQKLWEVIGDSGVGFCLDTCHAWASGQPLDGIVDLIKDATGGIDLVHCNDSRDPFDSRRDRHANLGRGEIPQEELIGVVQAAGTPVIVETPGGTAEHSADLDWLRSRL